MNSANSGKFSQEEEKKEEPQHKQADKGEETMKKRNYRRRTKAMIVPTQSNV
jgi:hypothetical protein